MVGNAESAADEECELADGLVHCFGDECSEIFGGKFFACFVEKDDVFAVLDMVEDKFGFFLAELEWGEVFSIFEGGDCYYLEGDVVFEAGLVG